MRTILPQLCTCLLADQAAVMCTIIESSGSAPRSSGARMLLCQDGRNFGTIGGGALEGESVAKARELLFGQPEHGLLHFDLTSNQAATAGMICGGEVKVLLQRVQPLAETLAFFQSLSDEYARGTSPVLLTLMSPELPPRLLIYIPGSLSLPELLPAFLGQLPLRLAKTSLPFTLTEAEMTLHCEPLIRPIRLYLVGAGHVALATAQLAGFLGLELIVMDDRPEFANRTRFPQAHEVRVVDSFDHCLADLRRNDYVVIVTRGHLHDQEVLVQALHTDAGYIGMIGSRRKRDAIYAALRREGLDERDFLRVCCPIGLPLGGESPEEIALCIMAEIQQCRYKKVV